MTLTACIPSLRKTLADPLDPAAWPDHSRATLDDVVTEGVSLVRCADICGTPCVHTGEVTVVPPRDGRPARREARSVAVVRVLRVRHADDRTLVVETDGRLGGAEPSLQSVRLLGRVSTAPDVAGWVLTDLGGGQSPFLPVPRLRADLREGDLLAVPHRGMLTVHDLRAEGGVR